MPLTTIKQLLQQARERIDPLDAELIVAHALKKMREFVVANPEQRVSKCVSVQVCKLFRKRAGGASLAHLTGHKEFFGLDFVVDKRVLIPRPETETLVEEVISFIIHHLSCNTKLVTCNKRVVLVDVGTGSGCIPIASTSALKHISTPAPKVFAIDISQTALRVAKINAKKHGAKIKFLRGDLLQPIANNLAIQQFSNSTLIITANLPYLTPKQYKQSPSIQCEPKSALVAGRTGLELYEKLLKQIKRLPNKTQDTINKTRPVNCGLRLTAFFEIDPSQSEAIKILIKKYLPNAKVQIKKDLAGLDRVVIIQN